LPSSSHQAHDERNEENDKEDEEQNLRNACRARRNATEPERCSNNRDDEKNQSVVEHDLSSVLVPGSVRKANGSPASQSKCRSLDTRTRHRNHFLENMSPRALMGT
jgi:hypothetical protein